MQKLVLLFLLSLKTIISFGQDDKNDSIKYARFLYMIESELSEYIENPNQDDSLCIKDINQAKNDIEKGQISFCSPRSMIILNNLRNEKYVRKVCENYGLIFQYEFFGCLTEGREGCYGGYMDKILAQKFGIDFKKRVFHEADSLLLASQDTVYFRECDEKPKNLGQNPGPNFFLQVDWSQFPGMKQKNYDYSAKIQITFYIDKQGNPSGYYFSHFDETGIKSVANIKYELYKLGLNYLNKNNRWNPAKIDGTSVMCKIDVVFSF